MLSVTRRSYILLFADWRREFQTLACFQAQQGSLYIMYVSIVHHSDCCFIVCLSVFIFFPTPYPFILQTPFVVLFSNLLDSLTDACETPSMGLANDAVAYDP
ncbi:Hypothetical predicted protein [Pelobates cultripes]|uniref:Uncharacterized protein n=1 Tax=Pelobates cultripes TaxID=61616 RepID=A0AAD1VY68_PELCU|nr:Hypothetical predicted protein [Pelobates cultripes]